MQHHIRTFVESCAAVLDCREPIYEFGSLQVPEQVGFSDLRGFFPGKRYIGCDMRAGVGVDQVEDLEKGLTVSTGAASTVLSFDTLEHVFDVGRAVSEMTRILRDDDGLLIVSSVFQWPIHAHPYDYWRFTPECFRRLLAGFDAVLTGAQGDPENPVSVIGLGVKTGDRPAWKRRFGDLTSLFQERIDRSFREGMTPGERLKLAGYRVLRPSKYGRKTQSLRFDWQYTERSGQP
jgi:SAM-dependent methyltransferase